MLPLYICHTSAYTKHMHTPGALNIPDMFHISICSGEKKHENRIDIQKWQQPRHPFAS
ncbi:toxin-antitoxin system, antitoxin component, AbrB family protein [Escherichia coli]|nr:toxin-antitoxin system, antitoxin component, AbrB family protein [Escherichia coli]RBX09660.1 toxin-antitoxin system, antitoxin component, AbrB family protein [Escherichia coli]RBX29362.1 toxin-antitoxin system, antitoxin component, AbrB family protein [Escherichia coli]RBX62465.1 toxin-antitoxin system, antitoxin component, AbrB family protein [Escherichia coli]RCX44141.1 toxin-antitoxin system, antitoxin component, AbrB family protein [Escherichia coli]